MTDKTCLSTENIQVMHWENIQMNYSTGSVLGLDTACVRQIWLNTNALHKRDGELLLKTPLTHKMSLSTRPHSSNCSAWSLKAPPSPLTAWPGQVWCWRFYKKCFFLPSTQGLPLVVKLPCEKLFICPVVESGIWQQMCLRCLARMFTGSLCGLFTPCGLGLTQREEKWVEIFCCHSKTAFFDHTVRQIPRWLAYSFSDQKWSVGIQQEMKWCKLISLARLSFTHVAQSDMQRLIFEFAADCTDTFKSVHHWEGFWSGVSRCSSRLLTGLCTFFGGVCSDECLTARSERLHRSKSAEISSFRLYFCFPAPLEKI